MGSFSGSLASSSVAMSTAALLLALSTASLFQIGEFDSFNLVNISTLQPSTLIEPPVYIYTMHRRDNLHSYAP